MKSQRLLEKESSTPQCDPVEASVKRACLAALQTENAQLKEENARLRAHIAALAGECAPAHTGCEHSDAIPVAHGT